MHILRISLIAEMHINENILNSWNWNYLQGHPSVRLELDLVEQEEQYTHEVSLDDVIDPETSLGSSKPCWVLLLTHLRKVKLGVMHHKEKVTFLFGQQKCHMGQLELYAYLMLRRRIKYKTLTLLLVFGLFLLPLFYISLGSSLKRGY